MARLTVLSHNVFWFQGAPYAPEMPGMPAPEVLEGLLYVYRAFSPDVVCLQEIQSEDVFERVGEALGMDGAFCPGCVHDQYGGGLYWRSGRLLADGRAAAAPPQRMWQIAEVQADGGVWTLANVHLASARQLGPNAATCSRIEDLEGLLRAGERPHVIAGDFNEGPLGAASSYLMQRGYLDTALLTGHEVESTGVGKDRSDQIWLDEPAAQWIAGFQIVPWARLVFLQDGKRWLSDHVPLVVQLEQ
ncbi:MAG TPA: hypothetical protein PLO62_03110 [Candidatus Hydrogenedentes bacterium]|nr:hypothetical protein [Candidatus Hydrogenedentota bacterium]HOS04039.1 hypothetical protein [Candidatus Hydrogenedentota bacterium]